MQITFTLAEAKQILISAVALSVAFAVAHSGGLFGIDVGSLPALVILSFVAVGTGFLAHELIGHKIIAQRFGLFAEFRMWRFGLVVALASSILGFVFAAPGAVYIERRLDLWGKPVEVTRKRLGIVALMGPVINMALGAAFIAAHLFSPVHMQGLEVFAIGASINIWLALFNMLPIPPLDGSKVLAWDKRVFAAVFVALLAMFVLV